MLKYHHNKILTPLLIEKYNMISLSKIPQIDRVLISSTSKNTINNQKFLFNILIMLELFTHQTPSLIRAKQSIASFKLKKGIALGGKVTIRKKSVWNFIMNMNNIIFPQLNEFQGFSYDKLINSIEWGYKEQGLTISLLFNKNSDISINIFILSGLQIPLIKK